MARTHTKRRPALRRKNSAYRRSNYGCAHFFFLPRSASSCVHMSIFSKPYKISMKEKTCYRIATDHWYNERLVYLVGGSFVLGSTLLGIFVNPGWHYFGGFVGFMLMSFALTGYCPMAIIMDKLGAKRQ